MLGPPTSSDLTCVARVLLSVIRLYMFPYWLYFVNGNKTHMRLNIKSVDGRVYSRESQSDPFLNIVTIIAE